jgi:LysR family transcriptional regulator, hydrogen peroxide-inducible genes activator
MQSLPTLYCALETLMETTSLRALQKVADLGSFTAAARSLGITQSAVSQQISRMEKDLGRALFERRGRQIELTEAGARLKEKADEILSMLDEAVRTVTDDGGSGRVSIGAIPTIAPYLLPPVLARCRKLEPSLRVEVHEEVTGSLVARCAAGEIDFGVMAITADRHNLRFEPLYDEELWLVLSRDHPLTRRRRLSLGDLESEPFVLLDEAHCLSGDIRSFCLRRRFQPIVTGRTTQLVTVLELVALGQGVSLIPDMARRADRDPRRVYRPLDGARPMRTIALCWKPQRKPSRWATRLADLFRENGRESKNQ